MARQARGEYRTTMRIRSFIQSNVASGRRFSETPGVNYEHRRQWVRERFEYPGETLPLSDVRTISQSLVFVIGHDRKGKAVHGKERRQMLESLTRPLSSMFDSKFFPDTESCPQRNARRTHRFQTWTIYLNPVGIN